PQASCSPPGAHADRLACPGDDPRLFVSTVSGTVASVPTSGTGASLFVFLGGSVQGIALSPSGSTLYATSTSGNVYRIDPTTLAIQTTRKLGLTLQGIAVAPD